jgi:cellulose synthase/poly-beta-1,6-N-acetylglucosamine synthase-like glycosyltransferase
MIYHGNLILSVIFSVFALSTAVQIYYYIRFYLAVSLYKHPGGSTEKKPVSVIVCARNEAENLRKFLPSVLEQKYPDYEVIVVNDCSEDDTYEVLGNFLLKYPSLKISTISKDPRFTHNKKFAQFIGIKAARNDILLFTDSDCQAESELWIDGMASQFDDKTDFVLGYGGYFSKKGFLNKYIRYDTLMIALQYLGMAIRGIPYMGVGRNLAYRRSLFFEKKGFGTHTHVLSGDDDLFVNSNATGNNTRVEFRKETHTKSVPCSTAKEWIIQKKRHLTTAPFYKLSDKLLLITEPFSRMLFYFSFILLVSLLFLWKLTIILFSLRLVSQIIVLVMGQRRLNERGLTGYSLIFDIFSPAINAIVYLSSRGSKPGKNIWK